MNLAPNVFNEDDEMLQLAMALNLNNQSQAKQQADSSASATINGLLERASKIYSNLSKHSRPTLETLLIKLNEQTNLDRF